MLLYNLMNADLDFERSLARFGVETKMQIPVTF